MRRSGTVKFFDPTKGYGFITPTEGGADVFVHISAVQRSNLAGLDPGLQVSFEEEPNTTGKGPKAIKLAVQNESA